MTVSWILLTHNRSEIVHKSFWHNFNCAGHKLEVIWCDNGSSLVEYELLKKSILYRTHIRYVENTGVARGYNSALALATGELVVITGCDTLMPPNWLATMVGYHDTIPNTGIVSIYSKPLETVPERLRGAKITLNDLPVVPAMPIERRLFKRELLKEIGYFHEGFGKYGYDDLAWAGTAERVCKEKGLLTYVIPNYYAEHLGTEGIVAYDGKDAKDYHEMKAKEVAMPFKKELLQKLAEQGYPAQHPF